MKYYNIFGLIGYPISHSFSKKYFTEKFKKEGIPNCSYELFPLEKIELLPNLLKSQPNLKGLNVTIPYKQSVLPFLDKIDPDAKEVGAVNTIKIENNILTGYNTDVYGFENSLLDFLNQSSKSPSSALILGNGGAAKAVCYVLKKLKITYQIVSRSIQRGDLTYQDLKESHLQEATLIINTTPLGMYPNIDSCPSIPYEYLSEQHFLYDLVYNPEKTLFLARGEKRGSKICNGFKMLHLQAEKAWNIWSQRADL